MKRYRFAFLAAGMITVFRPVSAQTLPAGEAGAVRAPVPQPAAQPVPESALQAIAEGRLAEAVRILEPLAASESAGFDVLSKLAGAYDKLALEAYAGKGPEARARSRQYRDKAVEGYLRAGALAEAAEDPRAQFVFELVLRYDPRNARALAALVRLASTGRIPPTQAIHYYQEYMKTPEGQADAAAQVEYGRLLVGEGFWRQAVSVLEKARAAGGGGAAERQLALAYLKGGQHARALELINQAIETDPNAPESYLARASLLLSADGGGQGGLAGEDRLARVLEDALKSVDLIRSAIADNPEDESQWRKLQLVFANGTQIAEGIIAQTAAQPLDPTIRVRAARIMGELGNLSRRLHEHRAVLFLKEGARAENASIDLLAALAQRQRDLGQAGAALETAERILKRDPNHAEAKLIKDSGGKRETK